jgi:hypothetical protein
MEETTTKQTEETKPCDVNVNVKPVKEKKPLSEDRLQKLAKAREIALKKRLENAKITQKEKELKRLSYEIRNKEVDERLQKLKQDGGEPLPTRCKVEDKGDSESEEEVIEIVRKNKSSKKKKIRKRIIEISSSSSSESEDESTIIKRHYKAKYKNKYNIKNEKPDREPQPRDVIKETAQDVIKSNVNKELRRLALASVFPDY